MHDLTSVTNEILDRPNAEAASFEGDGVAICGLPVFKIASAPPLDNVQARPEAHQDDTTEMTSIEAQVQSVVALVARLEKSEIKKSSSLLSLGLDSISAIKVSALLRRQGISITVNDLLKSETISKIASKIEQLKMQHVETNGKEPNGMSGDRQKLKSKVDALRSAALQNSTIPSDQIAEILPATSGQILMLSKWQNQGLYLPVLDFIITGTDDTNAVCEAWDQLVAQTAILRTAFVTTGNAEIPIVQVILTTSQKPATSVPASQTLDPAVAEFTDGKAGDGHLVTPAALFVQPAGKSKVHVMLRLSHALYDGYSIKLILDRLQGLLRQQRLSIPAPVGYLDHLGNILVGRRERKQFWTNYLANVKLANIPRLHARSSKRFHMIKPDIVPRVSNLQSFARQHGLSIQSVILAVYGQIYALLAKAGPDHDILLGAYVANRNFEGADQVDAPTLGFVPIRIKAGDRENLMASAKQVQHDLREIAQDTRGSISLQELHEWLGPEFKIDTWVNLILEETSASTDQPSVSFGEQRITKDEVYDVVSNTEDQKQGLFLQGNKIQELYSVCLTINPGDSV